MSFLHNSNGVPADSEKWSALLKRYGKFCVVGGSGLVVDMGIIWLLADSSRMAMNLALSKVIAAEVAILNNFLWNDLWTFHDLGVERSRWRARLTRLGKFHLICLAGIAWSVLLLNLQVYWLHVNVYSANLISIVAVSIWNFLLNLRFGWNNEIKRQTELMPATAPHR